MKSIGKTIVLHRLRNAEHFQVHRTMSNFLEEPVTDFTELTASFATYKQLFQHEDIVFKHRSKMVGTQAVVAADEKRDNEFISVRMGIKSGLRSIDPEIRATAELLMPVIDNYKKIPQKSYNEATAYVTNLVQEFKSIEYQPLVTKLGLESAVDLLDEANKAFELVYNKRSNWLEGQKQQGNMLMIRPQVDEAFQVLVELINALYVINEGGEKDADKRTKLTAIIDEINAELGNIARTIAYRYPGYTQPDPDPHPEPGPGPVEPFRFTAAGQGFVPSSVKMYIEAPDKEAFRSGVDNSVLGAIINFGTEENPNRFTIIGIMRPGNEQPDAIHLTPTDEQDLLGTFSGPEITVEAIKDERVVLIIDGVQCPDGLA